MKKVLNFLMITTVLVFGVLSLTGCDIFKKSVFEVESKDEKNVSVTLENVKKGSSKYTSVTISEGENITIASKINEDARVNVSLYRAGSKDELVTEDEMSYESDVTTEGLEEGKYDIYFTALDNNLTGTVNVTIK